MTNAIVFAGPSLTKEDIDAYPDIEFRAPVSDGDLFKAMAAEPLVIGIIDGFFGDRVSILHKEILHAMSNGIAVYGAASMGALRAAELSDYGMIGVGDVFHQVSIGNITEDEAVAVTHGPAEMNHVALSVATVDVQATLDAMTARDRLSTYDASLIGEASRSIHFTDRTWPRIADAMNWDAPDREALAKDLAKAHVQRKRLDALALLDRITTDLRQGAEPMRNPFRPPATPSFEAAKHRAASAE